MEFRALAAYWREGKRKEAEDRSHQLHAGWISGTPKRYIEEQMTLLNRIANPMTRAQREAQERVQIAQGWDSLRQGARGTKR